MPVRSNKQFALVGAAYPPQSVLVSKWFLVVVILGGKLTDGAKACSMKGSQRPIHILPLGSHDAVPPPNGIDRRLG